jgi:hypothetical protein
MARTSEYSKMIRISRSKSDTTHDRADADGKRSTWKECVGRDGGSHSWRFALKDDDRRLAVGR